VSALQRPFAGSNAFHQGHYDRVVVVLGGIITVLRSAFLSGLWKAIRPPFGHYIRIRAIIIIYAMFPSIPL